MSSSWLEVIRTGGGGLGGRPEQTRSAIVQASALPSRTAAAGAVRRPLRRVLVPVGGEQALHLGGEPARELDAARPVPRGLLEADRQLAIDDVRGDMVRIVAVADPEPALERPVEPGAVDVTAAAGLALATHDQLPPGHGDPDVVLAHARHIGGEHGLIVGILDVELRPLRRARCLQRTLQLVEDGPWI